MTKQLKMKSTNPSISTGSVAKSDLSKYGSVDVVFHLFKKQIGVEIAGFSSNFFYYITPKNQRQIKLNQFFIERYVEKCDNSDDFLKFFGL